MSKFDLKNIFILDIECYINYTLLMFKNVENELYDYYELYNDDLFINGKKLELINYLELGKIKAKLKNRSIVTYNGNAYDKFILEGFLSDINNYNLKIISDHLIHSHDFNARNEVYDVYPKIDKVWNTHIDLMGTLGERKSLKLIGARLGHKKLQELPIHPSQYIDSTKRALLIKYCKNDVDITEKLYDELKEPLKARVELSNQSNVNLLSRPDAAVAEAIIIDEVTKRSSFIELSKKAKAGEKFKYIAPHYVKFSTDFGLRILKKFLALDIEIAQDLKLKAYFTTDEYNVKIDNKKNKAKINYCSFLNSTHYTFALGGLHGAIPNTSFKEDDNYFIKDYDVTSYYTSMMLNSGMYPEQIGKAFIEVLAELQAKRIKMKAQGKGATLKIVLNGLYGRLGFKYGKVYAPQLMNHTAVTGQLSILMLIEELEENNIQVISANTDGITVRALRSDEEKADNICKNWEKTTGLCLEGKYYSHICIRDVNSYFAVENGVVKGKGDYLIQSEKENKLTKNQQVYITNFAVFEYVINNIPIEDTIMNCKDIEQFIYVATSSSGAYHTSKPDEKHKVLRWYYADSTTEEYFYYSRKDDVKATIGNSKGSKPLFDIPETLPNDICYDRYILMAKDKLINIGIEYERRRQEEVH